MEAGRKRKVFILQSQLTNPKTVLNAKYAKKEIKEKVIRADQLVKYIKEMYDKSKEIPDSDENLLAWAKSYLSLHKEAAKDYTAKYEKYRLSAQVIKETVKTVSADTLAEDMPEAVKDSWAVEETQIFKELKAYRLAKSREEKIKPYYIYNDNQLKDLIGKMPGTKEELMSVAGFGGAKAAKYGSDILKIIEKYR